MTQSIQILSRREMRRAMKDCREHRGRWPLASGMRFLGEVSEIRFKNGSRMTIGEPYERQGDYCFEGRWVVPHSFYQSRSGRVNIWCCWPFNRDERGRRTWEWLIGVNVEELKLAP